MPKHKIWSRVGLEVNFLAKDQNGRWGQYRQKPTLSKEDGCWLTGHACGFINWDHHKMPEPDVEWDKSLMAREAHRLFPDYGEPRTSQQIVDQTNYLARKIYEMLGYVVDEDYRFDKAHHPQEQHMWELACLAQEILTDTDVPSVLSEIDEDE